MYRNTYVEIYLKNIENNVKKIINKFDDYKYYFGVVKADSYGHYDIKTVRAIINGGCNYLAVATLNEALEIRKELKQFPILCLGIVPLEFVDKCIKNNITLTISNIEYFKKIKLSQLKNIKIHLKIDTGMNRLGINNKDDLDEIYKIIKENNLNLEGVFSHIYNADNNKDTIKQFNKFKKLTADIDLSTIPIVHIANSDTTIDYNRIKGINGCRLGIAMYGFTKDKTLNLESTFSLYSEIIQINDVLDGTVGYNGIYKTTGLEKIAVVPIGYADGIIRKNTGRDVFINNKRYKIIGNICMDMLFIKIDDSIKVNDKVVIIKDIDHINEIAAHLETISYEVLCTLGKRVPRKYID